MQPRAASYLETAADRTMTNKRIDELDRQIEAAERRYWAHWHQGRDKGDLQAGPEERAAHTAVSTGLMAALDLLRAKRTNVAAGLPETHGMARSRSSAA